MRKKILAAIIAAAMMVTVFTGCGSKTSSQEDSGSKAAQNTTDTQKNGTQEDTTASKFPLTVTDANGTEVKFDAPQKNIVSLTLGTDEMLLSLVDKSRIKSMTTFVDDANISNVTEAAKGVGVRTASEAEQIIALQPDLVFVDTWAAPDFVKQLRDAQIPVYVFKTPSNVEEQRKTVLEIAHVVGADENGQEIVNWMDAKLKEVEQKLSALKPEQKLKVMEYGEMGTCSGIGTNFDDVVTRAGLINVASKAGLEGWPQISKEKVVEWNPDIILIPSWYYDAKNTLDSFKKSIKEDPSLTTVKAVTEDRLIAVPNPHISAISQYVVLGVEDVAKAAYPDLFK